MSSTPQDNHYQFCQGAIKRTKVQCPTSNNVHLTSNYFAVGVQFWSFSTEKVTLKSNKDTTTYITCSVFTASKESGKISEFLISGVNQNSFPKMRSGFAELIIV